jgi:hypothetical protein
MNFSQQQNGVLKGAPKNDFAVKLEVIHINLEIQSKYKIHK